MNSLRSAWTPVLAGLKPFHYAGEGKIRSSNRGVILTVGLVQNIGQVTMVRAKTIDMVIVAKLDRLTRSVKDLAVLLELFQRRGVSLVSVAEALDTGSAAGRLLLNIMVSVSQWEREAIGERTRDAMRHKKSKQEFLGNTPYGFRLSADKQHVELDPKEQQILRAVKNARRVGKSLRAIADRLNEGGYRTRSGSPWRFEYIAKLAKAS